MPNPVIPKQPDPLPVQHSTLASERRAAWAQNLDFSGGIKNKTSSTTQIWSTLELSAELGSDLGENHPPLPPPVRRLCPSPQTMRIMRSLIEQLPVELQRMIFAGLDYESLIHLSTTNRYFNHILDPQQMALPDDKLGFVMRAAKDFPQHRPSEKGTEYHPGNFECYLCFRVRSPDCFDVHQALFAYVDRHGQAIRDREPTKADALIPLRRFCIECGVRAGLHVPTDNLTTKTGRDLWVCRCWRIWPKPSVLQCPECGGDCPLRPRKKMGVEKFPLAASISVPTPRWSTRV